MVNDTIVNLLIQTVVGYKCRMININTFDERAYDRLVSIDYYSEALFLKILLHVYVFPSCDTAIVFSRSGVIKPFLLLGKVQILLKYSLYETNIWIWTTSRHNREKKNNGAKLRNQAKQEKTIEL